MSYIQILCTYLCLAQVSSAAPSPKKRWTINTNNTVQDSPIFVDDGRIVVFGTEAASSKRTENNGSAFFVYGVDAKTGHEHWSFQAPGHPCTAIFALCFHYRYFRGQHVTVYSCAGGIYSSPIVEAGSVYFGCDDGNLFKLHAATGKLR